MPVLLTSGIQQCLTKNSRLEVSFRANIFSLGSNWIIIALVSAMVRIELQNIITATERALVFAKLNWHIVQIIERV